MLVLSQPLIFKQLSFLSEKCLQAEFLTHLFPTHPFFTPLKTSENRKVFRGQRKGALGTNGLKKTKIRIHEKGDKQLVLKL